MCSHYVTRVGYDSKKKRGELVQQLRLMELELEVRAVPNIRSMDRGFIIHKDRKCHVIHQHMEIMSLGLLKIMMIVILIMQSHFGHF